MSIDELEMSHLPKLLREQVQKHHDVSLLGTLGITIDVDARCMGTE